MFTDHQIRRIETIRARADQLSNRVPNWHSYSDPERDRDELLGYLTFAQAVEVELRSQLRGVRAELDDWVAQDMIRTELAAGAPTTGDFATIVTIMAGYLDHGAHSTGSAELAAAAEFLRQLDRQHAGGSLER